MRLFEQEIDRTFILDSFSVSLTTFALIILCECLTWNDKEWQKKYTSSPDIRKLYMQAVYSNLVHFGVVAPAAYAIMSAWIFSYCSTYPSYISVPGALLTQGIGYAVAHSWMHIPKNYWIHKYHHLFNEKTFVRPIAANAVTVVEFSLAYALPLVMGGLLFRPSVHDTYYIVMSVSLANLAIHTPSSLLDMSYLPNIFCTNEKHFYHHEHNVRKHYAAPIFDLDSVLKNCYPKSDGDKKKNK